MRWREESAELSDDRDAEERERTRSQQVPRGTRVHERPAEFRSAIFRLEQPLALAQHLSGGRDLGLTGREDVFLLEQTKGGPQRETDYQAKMSIFNICPQVPP